MKVGVRELKFRGFNEVDVHFDRYLLPALPREIDGLADCRARARP